MIYRLVPLSMALNNS